MPDPRKQQRQSEEMMRVLAGAIDSALKDATGQRYGFALVVFEQTDTDRTNYISNCDRSEVAAALRATADRLEGGTMMPPGAITDLRDN